ncbi:hypothetical protein FMN50_02345 [Rhodobacterales bacterium]|nr:hypothetical protein FMN50_02345 [Rhodobacterales bacterium]
MRFVKLILRVFGFLIAVAIAIPVLVIAALQVPAGRTFVSNLVSDLASSETQSVRVENLHVGFSLDAKVGGLTVGDQDGTWLQASNLALDWKPLHLFSGDLDISSLTADRIDFLRPPAGAPADDLSVADATTDDESGSFSLPLNVSLEKLALNEINIAEPLLGAPVSLNASGSGSFALDPALISADIDIHRIDGVDGSLTANAQFEPAAETLVFDVSVSEPRGGLAARLLDVPDLPAVDVNLKGDGPLTNWSANLEVALDGRQTVTGSASLEEKEATRLLAFDLDGDLAALAPPSAQAFVMGTTQANGTATFSHDFAPQSADVTMKTDTVSLNAKADLNDEKVNVSADLAVSAGDGALIAVDLGERRVAFGPLSLTATAIGERSSATWQTRLDLASLQTEEARTGRISLTASGKDANLEEGVMTSPFEIELAIAALAGLIPATEPLSGDISASGSGTLDGADQSVALSTLMVNTPVGEISLTDTKLSANEISGQGRLLLADLGKLSKLADRDLGGSTNGSFSVAIDPSTLEGDVTAALVTHDLKTGVAQADALMAGESRIDTEISLAGQNDVTVKSLSVRNNALSVSGTAAYQAPELTSDLQVELTDLAKLDPQVSGAVKLDLATSGPLDQLKVQANAASEKILLAGTPLDDLTFSADALADPSAPTAVIKSTASLNGQPIAVDVDLTSKDGGATIDPVSIDVAGNTIKGTLVLADLTQPVETLKGRLAIDAPDLDALSPLLLTRIGGQLKGTVTADPDRKTLALDITGSDIEVPSVTLGTLELNANVKAPYSPETVTADIVLANLATDVTPIHGVTIEAKPDDGGTAITADVEMDSNGKDGLTAKAHVSSPQPGGYLVALSELAMQYQGLSSKLLQPTKVTYVDGEAVIEPLELKLGDGSLSVSGKAGQTIDVAAELKQVPLNLANAFVPSLGLGGTLSGKVSAAGDAASPQANWSITGAGLTAAELRNNGLSSLSLNSSGDLNNNTISQTSSVSDANGLKLTVSGNVGVAAPNSLSLKVDGTVPAAAIRRPMLEAGLRGEGAIALSGSIGGSVQSPSYQITATPTSLKITSLSTGITVENVKGTASISQDQAAINGISGDLATGGSFSAGGTVGMKDGFPADLTLKLNKGRYIDPGLVTADVDADLKIAGPLASPSSSALISGEVTINKADVSIPEYLPGAIPPVDVKHVNASPAIREQVAELGGETNSSGTQQTSNPPRLDILLSAPGRIFVRGRGLDSELQGSLQIVGTTANPRAVGAFTLKRGQLDVLTRRLVFSHGSATFDGSLAPILDFGASTTVSDTTITVAIDGEASDPNIGFSSSPELPQDEVLALLLFGKNVGNLSPTQIAQLAAAVATLTGGSDNGPLASIRKSLGLDTLDINTDGDGGPSLAVGKYINDNIYLGVEQGTGSGSSRVKVDIDLNRGLKVRGEVGADGSSKAGIFFEKEY